MPILYTTKASATGGRAGHAVSENGVLDVTLTVPKELGGFGLSLAEVAREQRRLAYYAAPTALGINMHLYWTGVAADLWRRGDRPSGRLVVERYVAAGHGEGERSARIGEPAHALRQLPERLGSCRVAVVEAVRDAERPRAGDRNVPGGLGDAQCGAQPWIEGSDGLVCIRRCHERLRRALDPDDRGTVACRSRHRNVQLAARGFRPG